MTSKIRMKSGGLLLLALTGAVFVLGLGLRSGERADLVVTPSVTSLSPEPVPPRETKNLLASGIAREELAILAGAPAPVALPSSFRVRGHVVGLDGSGVPGVGVVVRDRGPRVRAVSGEDGSFTLRLGVESAVLLAEDERWTTVRSCLAVRGRPDEENLLIVAETFAFSGTVVDEKGAAIAKAGVEVYVLAQDLPGFEPAWRQTGRLEWWATTDADGHFHFERSPAVPGALLHTIGEGFRPDYRALPSQPTDALRIVLTDAPTIPCVTGVVRHADGRIAPGAQVFLGGAKTHADRAGAFQLDVPTPEPDADLVAALGGYRPAILPSFGNHLVAGGESPEAVELVLGAPTLAIEGRIVDGRGEPLKGWHVSLAAVDARLEKLAGAATARTDQEGRFRIGGLGVGPYVLRSHARSTGPVVESEPIEAPRQDVLLRVPDGLAERWISGRVIDDDGRPLEGARVGVARPTASDPQRESDLLSSPRTTTDAQGRFLLERAPGGWTRLVALSETTQPMVVTLSPDAADEAPDLVAPRRLP